MFNFSGCCFTNELFAMPFATPTLLLDQAKCVHNITRMAARAKHNNVLFRPHFKTHQSHEIGRWFKDVGVAQITVSSLEMAAYFVADGWKDITVAFPLNILEVGRIQQLAGQVDLNLVVGSLDNALATLHLLPRSVHLGIFIKIDNGYHRTGLDPADSDTIHQVIGAIAMHANLYFKGFLSHEGHAYGTTTLAEIEAIHQQRLANFGPLRERYQGPFPQLAFSVGDTPTCSRLEVLSGVDEIRPGNFVFYDLMQVDIGACGVDDIAVAVACPVVATHPERNEAILYGGGVHLSKEQGVLPDGSPYFGLVCLMTDDGWGAPLEGVYIRSLSQEHAIVSAGDKLHHFKPGAVVAVLPIHSCMTVDLYRNYRTTSGGVISRH